MKPHASATALPTRLRRLDVPCKFDLVFEGALLLVAGCCLYIPQERPSLSLQPQTGVFRCILHLYHKQLPDRAGERPKLYHDRFYLLINYGYYDNSVLVENHVRTMVYMCIKFVLIGTVSYRDTVDEKSHRKLSCLQV